MPFTETLIQPSSVFFERFAIGSHICPLWTGSALDFASQPGKWWYITFLGENNPCSPAAVFVFPMVCEDGRGFKNPLIPRKTAVATQCSPS